MTFEELITGPQEPAPPIVVADFPPPPDIPRPGVYRVLRLVGGEWKWELTAAPDVRLYWQMKEDGTWPT